LVAQTCSGNVNSQRFGNGSENIGLQGNFTPSVIGSLLFTGNMKNRYFEFQHNRVSIRNIFPVNGKYVEVAREKSDAFRTFFKAISLRGYSQANDSSPSMCYRCPEAQSQL
jgi:hypothetical protein